MQRTALVLVALALATGAAQAQEKYQRKSGLWELKRTSTVSGGQARVYRMCVDEASDNALMPLGEGAPGDPCQTSNVQRAGDKVTLEATCKIAKSVATTHAVITGKFDSSYKIESKTTFEPPLRGHADSTAVWEAKWTGACKPDQRPGDVIGARGDKSNVNEPAKAAAPEKTKKPTRKKKGNTTPEAPPSTAK